MYEKPYLIKEAKKELGLTEFRKRYRSIFGEKRLDFVRTLVLNVPYPCRANCDYCIDKELRFHTITTNHWFKSLRLLFHTFPEVENVTITGGHVPFKTMRKILNGIDNILAKPEITWNTSGINIDRDYRAFKDKLTHVNLHRNHFDDKRNQEIFKTSYPIISIEEAKKIFGEKLSIRSVVDKNFDLDEYAKFGVPLFLNRLLPITDESDELFDKVAEKLDGFYALDVRRRNAYMDTFYNGLPVRLGYGDTKVVHKPNREWLYLNVAILHRSGIISGTWYEDDKVIYDGRQAY